MPERCEHCGEPATGTYGVDQGNWSMPMRQVPACDEHNPYANLVAVKASGYDALQADNEALRKALQWCLDEGGWRLLYYASRADIPEAIEYDGGTSIGRVRALTEGTDDAR